MVSRVPRPKADPEVESEIAPVGDTPLPGVGADDHVPRLSADDGQGGPEPAVEFDDPALHSELAPDPEPVADPANASSAIAGGETTPATEPEPAPARTPAPAPTGGHTLPSLAGLTNEQIEQYVRAGMAAEMGYRAEPQAPGHDRHGDPRHERPTTPQRRRPADPAAPEGGAVPDDDTVHLSRQVARQLDEELGLSQTVAEMRELVSANRQERLEARERRVHEFANDFLDEFCQTNPIAASDPDVAEFTREQIRLLVADRLNQEREAAISGRRLPEINWRNAIAKDAAAIAIHEKNRLIKRDERIAKTRQTTQVDTRPSTGGVTPAAGSATKPKTSKDRGDEMERSLRAWEPK